MTVKELFKMIEEVNKFNDLMGCKRKYITFSVLNGSHHSMLNDKNDEDRFYTFSDFKKAVKYNYIDELVDTVLTSEFVQSDEEVNYFSIGKLEMAIFES